VVVGEVAPTYDVVAQLRHTDVNVLLLDLCKPEAIGIELISKVHREIPGVPILVLSMSTEGGLIFRALKAGAAGFVTKGSEAGILITALRKVAAGEKYIDPSLVNQLVFESMSKGKYLLEQLSNREYQVLQMLANGKSVTDIARYLNLSVKTISTHKSNAKEKLGLQADSDLFRYAIEHLS
jgi:DNA-binding NarL/FixJ family response regulator